MSSCGKKGPPLPPLVKLPIAPAQFTAERRGVNVDLQFTVPSANTDNTRPANVARVDVYAITGAATATDDEIRKYGTRVASVAVKAPRDPNQTIEEDEPDGDMDALEGKGLDQGAAATFVEELTSEAQVPVELPAAAKAARDRPPQQVGTPLMPPMPVATARTYVAVGVTTRDRRGPFSKRIAVPLLPPPPPPPQHPEITYDEKSITVKWVPAASAVPVQAEPQDGELPSTPIGVAPPKIGYHVYDTETKARLTKTPLDVPEFSDARVAFGERRCYAVRSVEMVNDQTVESESSPADCAMLNDSFPPAVPANLKSAPTEGAINLIWDANTEKDLAGYVVLRGPTAAELTPLMTAPIPDPIFRDEVKPGTMYWYAVRAVDKAGNASPASMPVQETAR